MKKIQVLSFLCLIVFACDTAVSNSTSNNETDGLSSSSVANLSSSSERNPNIPLCKPYLSKISENPLYFNKQGGIDTVAIGWPRILFADFSDAYDYFSNTYAYRDIAQCEFFLIDHYTYSYGENFDNYSRTKVESDYCKNNYCANDYESSYGSSHSGVPIMKIECPWFSVTHISKDSVQVSVKKNETGEERSQHIPLFSGGCALGIIDNITIIQTSTL